ALALPALLLPALLPVPLAAPAHPVREHPGPCARESSEARGAERRDPHGRAPVDVLLLRHARRPHEGRDRSHDDPERDEHPVARTPADAHVDRDAAQLFLARDAPSRPVLPGAPRGDLGGVERLGTGGELLALASGGAVVGGLAWSALLVGAVGGASHGRDLIR